MNRKVALARGRLGLNVRNIHSEGKYYKLVAATETAPASISWVDNIADADEHISGDDGKVAAFTGLAAGTYTLEEKTVPSGFNKAADVVVTVAANDYTKANLEQDKPIVNNKGAELPSTGGMGTTIFYIIGAILVIGAGVVLVTRRRMNAN